MRNSRSPTSTHFSRADLQPGSAAGEAWPLTQQGVPFALGPSYFGKCKGDDA